MPHFESINPRTDLTTSTDHNFEHINSPVGRQLSLSAELQKVFRRDIPLKERDDWSEWLADRRQAHQAHTAEIVRLETELNARVYALFDLTPEEIRTIEESTKYRYGEV